jgi:hypothetical protein
MASSDCGMSVGGLFPRPSQYRQARGANPASAESSDCVIPASARAALNCLPDVMFDIISSADGAGPPKADDALKYITAIERSAECTFRHLVTGGDSERAPRHCGLAMARFVTGIVIQIIDAGLAAEKSDPWFIHVFDTEGRPWHVPAHLMGRNEIIRYVRQRFGDYAACSVAAAESLTVH